jgi:hypothetical protein
VYLKLNLKKYKYICLFVCVGGGGEEGNQLVKKIVGSREREKII